MQEYRRPFFHSIRFKLALVSLTLLVIPWAGYRYIQETEIFLRRSQETMLLGTAQAVAAILHNHEEMFISAAGDQESEKTDTHLYVNPLNADIQLDGYTDDWQGHLRNIRSHPEQGEVVFESLMGEQGGYIYLLLQVRDDRLIYQRPGERRMDHSDHVELAMESPEGELKRYRITTTSPGWVNAEQMPENRRAVYPVVTEVRIQGEWQESREGYTLELRIPRYLIGDRLAFSIADVDDPISRALVQQTATAPMTTLATLGQLVRPNPVIEQLIGGLEHENARIWVLDRNRRVLAQRGQLKTPDQPTNETTPNSIPGNLLHLLFQLILVQPTDQFEDEFSGRSRLQGPEITQALTGEAKARRRSTADGRAVVLSAAWPIHSPDGIIGTVLVEQTTNQILSLQNEALERLFAVTLTFFLFTGLALLGFASLLTGRIHRLRNRVEEAVSPDGRILGTMKGVPSQDEIGDLERSFANVFHRLEEYNRYLEAMASRLAHELRTPLVVVKGSLDNLEVESSGNSRQRYIDRAREGTERLGLILYRMREATRLEQLMQQTETELFDLADLIKIASENYHQAFPGTHFLFHSPSHPIMLTGAPDLISQALDKLISNAVDFHSPNTPIELQLTEGQKAIQLEIHNQGPLLPSELSQNLFDSMVSLRPEKGTEPHLGLGLYLVRLICEFHGGKVAANNLADGSGVGFTLTFPTIV
ncbi:MAG: proteobacterial dedicated sortase system histidine kinase [Candidatus Sedimenticola sp. (ex Thyasira tokunagai)]